MSTAADDMQVKAIAPWYGAKRTLAPRIIQELGSHSAYWAPFCGSMAELLVKPPAMMETVNDLHGDLINLARVLASPLAFDLYERSLRTVMHQELWEEARSIIFGAPVAVAPSQSAVEQVHVDRAWNYLVLSWQGRNGNAGTVKSNHGLARRWTSNGGSGGIRWNAAVESIPAWHHRLRTVTILREDAFLILERIDDQAGTSIYVDPPYLRKSDKYEHDLDPADHSRLAELLARFKRARVVVSYYDEPELRELYQNWTWVECPVVKGLSLAGKAKPMPGKALRAPEVLIINGRSLSQSRTLFDG